MLFLSNNCQLKARNSPQGQTSKPHGYYHKLFSDKLQDALEN